MSRLVAVLALSLIAFGLLSSRPRATTPGAAQAAAGTPSHTATEAEARVVCGTGCHAFPPPEVLPRAAWRDAIAWMSIIRANQFEPRGTRRSVGRMLILPQDMERVLRYYLANAPEELPPPKRWPAADTTGFVRRDLTPASAPPDPAIANVRLLDLDGNGRLELVATDMRYGMLLKARPYEATPSFEILAQLNSPAHVTSVDFDGDGIPDFLVADLGEFLPSDHTRGSVVWLRGQPDGKFGTLALDGWPRVADVEAADFNGDGRLDLAVASFGWRKVGNLTVLENQTTDYNRPSFVPRLIDPRPGAIHAIPVDLNKDGHMDLVVLFAQQFEEVVAFINTGSKEIAFTPHVLFRAPHPNWGSSGIQVVDLDGDGDMDVLVTHGDTFDDDLVKPYHGIFWLENRGSYPFAYHRIADLPGASRAQAGDLDGDGDLDIVAAAFIAGVSDQDESQLPALVWLEQTRPGVFERRTLAMGMPRNATLDLGDYDLDGDLDIVAGKFMIQPRPMAWVELWENNRATRRGAR